MTASDIIELFRDESNPICQGRQALATLLGVPLTTVSAWARANYIPTWRQPELLALAHKLGKRLSTSDFPAKAPRRRSDDLEAA